MISSCRLCLTTVFLLMISCAGEAAQLSSSSNIVRIENGVINVNLGRDFPGSIALVAPNGNFYVIRDDEISCRGVDVINKSVVQINALKISGVLWKDGDPKIKKIFTVSGKYKIVIASNLETELDGANASVVEVNYVRPSKIYAASDAEQIEVCSGIQGAEADK